jgi:hypothetical protein
MPKKITLKYLTPFSQLNKGWKAEDMLVPMPQPLPRQDIENLICYDKSRIIDYVDLSKRIFMVCDPYHYKFPKTNLSVRFVAYDGNKLCVLTNNHEIIKQLPFSEKPSLETFLEAYKQSGFPTAGNKMLEMLYTIAFNAKR